MVWERGWLLATLLVYLLWSLVQGGKETAAADPVLGWMEAGEIHSDSCFVYLHVFHFNFLVGGQALQKFIGIHTISKQYPAVFDFQKLILPVSVYLLIHQLEIAVSGCLGEGRQAQAKW